MTTYAFAEVAANLSRYALFSDGKFVAVDPVERSQKQEPDEFALAFAKWTQGKMSACGIRGNDLVGMAVAVHATVNHGIVVPTREIWSQEGGITIALGDLIDDRFRRLKGWVKIEVISASQARAIGELRGDTDPDTRVLTGLRYFLLRI